MYVDGKKIWLAGLCAALSLIAAARQAHAGFYFNCSKQMELFSFKGELTPDGQPADFSATVDPSKVTGRKDPYFHSLMFEALKGGEWGMAADDLRNGSFEGPLQTTGLPEGWDVYPSGRLHNGEWYFEIIDNDSVPAHLNPRISKPQQALLVVTGNEHVPGGGKPMPRGVSQHQLPVENGKTYKVTFWAKGISHDGESPYRGNLRVTLAPPGETDRVYAEGSIPQPTEDWQQYEVDLTAKISEKEHPTGKDPAAWLTIHFDGRGALLLDHVRRINENKDGIKLTVYKLLKALRPNSIRQGGIADSFKDLEEFLGPVAERFYWFNGWDRTLQAPHFGPTDYLKLNENLKSKPTLTINLHGKKSLESTMRLLEYLWGSIDTPMGSLRAAHGFKKPFPKFFIELGNEPWLAGYNRGSPINPAFVRNRSPVTYANRAKRFVKAILERYPDAQFIAAGDRDMRWNNTVIKKLGKYIWGLAVHWYVEWNERDNQMAAAHEIEKVIHAIQDSNKKANGVHPLKIAFNEWTSRIPMPYQQGMEGATSMARIWNMLMRNSPDTTMVANAMTVNSFTGELIGADEWGNTYVTPSYLINFLYRRRQGPDVVEARVEGLTPESYFRAWDGKELPYLDVASTRSKDGHRLYLYIVNTNLKDAEVASIALQNVESVKKAEWKLITADSLETVNTFDRPDAIHIEDVDLDHAGPQMRLKFPKHSISVITLWL